MDFFTQQDQAHRESKKLLILFFLAVVAIVISVNFALAFAWNMLGGHTATSMNLAPHTYPPGFFVMNTVVTLLIIGGGSLFEMFRLRDGGDAVAEMVGGRLIAPNSADVQERRLLNIVEEMALASGIACPRVYILDHEDAINAFAAGYHQNEAVVAVTRGTLARLTRDELQGVVGHEFSHILNGDMRMNVKLIGVLFGIQMIASFGQQLMYWGARLGGARDRDDKGPSLQMIMVVVGVALFVIGYVGIFFGRLIKSAVSRQREFLADASAVQFTRNPDGIGNALRKIGGLGRVNQCGSQIDNPHAEQLSHMFLGAASPNLLSGLFATHPPLEERLRRVFGREMGFVDASEIVEADNSPALSQAFGFAGNAINTPAAPVAMPTQAGLGIGFGAHTQTAVTATATAITIAPELLAAARDAANSSALLFALLLDRSDDVAYQSQLAILAQSAPQLSMTAVQLLDHLERAPRSQRLSLLDLAMPAMKSLDDQQKGTVLMIVQKLIAADQRMSQAEFVLLTILERRLGAQAGRVVPVRYARLNDLKNEAAILLSLLISTIAEGDVDLAKSAVVRALDSVPDLILAPQEVLDRRISDFYEVKIALGKLNQLAPLAKPFLIRLLMNAAGDTLNADTAELLRAICTTIDAPLPEKISNYYATAV